MMCVEIAMGHPRIAIPKDAIADFCRRHHIRKLFLFGSVLRDDFRPDSDVDVLVEFQPGCTPGLAFISIRDELADLLGVSSDSVDMVTAKFLSPYIRDRVIEQSRVLYAA